MISNSNSIKLAISIVNWRSADFTVACLSSLADQVEEGTHVYVVENGSLDDSEETIRAAIAAAGWDWVTLICVDHNHGFAAGNNIAIRQAIKTSPVLDFVLLLNPDTLVRPNALKILTESMISRSDVGIAGGRSEDFDGEPQDCSFRFYNPIGELSSNLRLGLFGKLASAYVNDAFIPTDSCEVDWVSGAFAMIRAEVFEDIGLMDEGYFLYFEETDFILRARRQGWKCWHIPSARVVHFVGQSSGVTDRRNRQTRRPGYWYESRTRYFLLNHGRLYASITDLLAMAGHLVWEFRRVVFRKPDPSPAGYLSDLLRHSALWRSASMLAPRQTE